MKQTKYTITEACKKAGMSRSKFYKDYINKGIISKSKEGRKVFIDASEFNRVFPEVSKKENIKLQNVEIEHIKDKHTIQLLEQENKLIKEQLEELKKDKEYYRLLTLTDVKKENKSWFEKFFSN
jgi:hypothetical protein